MQQSYYVGFFVFMTEMFAFEHIYINEPISSI